MKRLVILLGVVLIYSTVLAEPFEARDYRIVDNDGDVLNVNADGTISVTGGGSVSDTAYNATSWDNVTDVSPSKNAIRDKIETLVSTPGGSDTQVQFNDGGSAFGGDSGFTYNKTTDVLTVGSIATTASDGSNKILMTNNTSISPTASSDELYFEGNVLKVNENGTEKTVAKTNMDRHLRFNIVDPLAVQTEDNEICLWPSTDAPITISKVQVTLDSSSYDVAGDVKYADAFIGLANAVVIDAFDTASGVIVDTNIASGAVVAGKTVYLSFDSAPDTAIKQMAVDITYYY